MSHYKGMTLRNLFSIRPNEMQDEALARRVPRKDSDLLSQKIRAQHDKATKRPR